MTEVTKAMEIVKKEYELPNNFLELWQSDSERRGIFATLTFELSKNGDNRTVEQFIFDSIDNFKKVVIPKFIAEAMQVYDSLQMMLGEGYYSSSSEEIGNDDIQCWIDENFETLCRAWLDGYEVKKEKLYYVSLPYLGFMTNSFDFPLTKAKEDGAKSTEQQIKSIDERYWAFAVEVEG